ncbi:MAG: short-chain dehydrogenase/reductase [Acidimicrobiia bacterium]|nr:short-chain dehydrogenase/reductase [Acidimicrobiia bacterium]
MDLELNGKRALVTGASKGIGLGIARGLAAEGVHVTMVARSADRLAAEAERIASELHIEAAPFPCDLSQSDEQHRLADHLTAEPLDIVVNNAGAIPGGSITNVDEETWRDAWDLKVFGYINLTRLLLPHLEAQATDGAPRVLLNVIGAAADRPSPGYIAGAVGNSGLVALSKAIGSNSIRRGVRVLAVNPGLIITDRMGDLLKQQAEARWGDPSRWEELIPEDPAPGTVEQVADVVTFLVSARASHVSGTALTIDGGAGARS